MISNSPLCVLTGASGGIGQAMAKALHEQGYQLLLVGRNELKLAQLSKNLGNQHSYITADLATIEGRDAVVNKAQKLGGVSVLINNAGVNQMASFDHQHAVDISKTLEMNLLVPMLLTQSFLAQLSQKERATIVNIGSAFGSIGFPYYASYCASKFGLRGFTEALKRELSDKPIDVLYLAPRATDTQINGVLERAMNVALGNHMDSPELVAKQLVKQLNRRIARTVIGFPEVFFAKLNGIFPSLVDTAISKKLVIMKQVMKQTH